MLGQAKQPQTTARSNVQARLFNSTLAKTALNETVESVRRCLQSITHPGGSNSTLDKEIGGTPLERSESERSDTQSEEGSLDNFGRSNALRQRVSKKTSCSDEDDHEDDFLGQLEQRIAASSDGESTDALNEERHDGSEWSGMESTQDEDGEGSSVSIQRASTPKLKRPEPRNANIKASAPSKPRSTTFLPTLSMGGYWSGSDEDSDKVEDISETRSRRNKRGQRARRQIYEKKFGANANHLKKAAESRDHGWDPQKGAVDDVKKSEGKRGRKFERKRAVNGSKNGGRSGTTRGPQSSGANTEPLKTRAKSTVDAPIHPSWQAAKKAKELKKTVPFQGKKVTFD